MTEKKTKTFSLDAANHRYVSQQDNASAVVNDLLTQVREGGDSDTAALDLQIQQKREELTEARNRVERLERGLDELKQLREAVSNTESAQLEAAREALEKVEKDPTNPAIKKWAQKLGMEPTRLVQQLR